MKKHRPPSQQPPKIFCTCREPAGQSNRVHGRGTAVCQRCGYVIPPR